MTVITFQNFIPQRRSECYFQSCWNVATRKADWRMWQPSRFWRWITCPWFRCFSFPHGSRSTSNTWTRLGEGQPCQGLQTFRRIDMARTCSDGQTLTPSVFQSARSKDCVMATSFPFVQFISPEPGESAVQVEARWKSSSGATWLQFLNLDV